MQISKQNLACLLALALCLTAIGCGPGFRVAPVSGKITINGEPAKGIKIVFYPKGSDANPNPGPFSTGVTDDEGKYSLTTRDKVAGAVVGEHRVMLDMADGDSGVDQESLDEAKSEMDEARSENDKASFEKAKKRYERMKKKMDKFKGIPPGLLDGNVLSIVTVPSGGTTEADFDLAESE